MNPKISIVTPSFNQARYIEQCILSVLDQDYPNVEHVIFDGGSRDGTLEVLRRYENRGVRWTSEKDKGQSDAINKGFRAATGDLIGWINSDDWYARGAFRIVLDYFREHPEADIVYGNNFFTNSEGRVIRRLRTLPYKWEWVLYTGLLIPQPGIFMRRRVIEDCGVLDVDLHSVMDYEWWLRIAQKYPPHFIDKFLAYFRLHEASKTGAGQDKPIWRRERFATMRKYEQQKPPRVAGRLGRGLAQAGKQLARLARALTGPGPRGLHCAPRAVILHSILSPYRVPLFNALHDRHDLDTQVWTLAEATAQDREWKVAVGAMRCPCWTLRGTTIRLPGQALEKRRFVHVNTDLLPHLRRERPDAVVASEFSLASAQAALYCAWTGAALVLWSETTPQFEQHMGPGQRALRRWLIRRASACIATSSESREKFLLYGARPEDVFVSLQTAEVDGIAERSRLMRPQRARYRALFGWTPDDVALLYVGSFIERKGLDALLTAFAAAVKDAPALRLALVGGGEQEAALRKQTETLGITRQVILLPFRQQPDLWDIYAAADAFVLPSRLDTFGVVVTEAMAAGLPVLVSRHAGAAQDLVADGENGWVIDPAQPERIAQRLVTLAGSAPLRAEMGAASSLRVRRAAPAAAAAEFHRAIQHALASSGHGQ